jgi:pseudouridine kinase
MQTNHDNSGEPVVVVGAACLDIKCRLRGDVLASTSNSADVRISVGGCARNVAENLARLGYPTTLVTVVCDDDFGQAIVQQTARAGSIPTISSGCVRITRQRMWRCSHRRDS